MKKIQFMIMVIAMCVAMSYGEEYNMTIKANHSNCTDAYINRMLGQNSNYDVLNLWFSWYDGNQNYIPLIWFDLSQLPASSTVSSCTLSLYFYNQGLGGSGDTEIMKVYRITSPWRETAVTYNDSPAFDTSTGIQSDTFRDNPYNIWIDLNLKTLAQGWVSKAYPNYGVVLGPTYSLIYGGNYGWDKMFYSSEYVDVNPDSTPRLYISFSTMDTPAKPVIMTPAYNSAIANRKPSFRWYCPANYENNNTSFEFQISQDSIMTTVYKSISTAETLTGFEYSNDNGATWTAFTSSELSPDTRTHVRYTMQTELDYGYWYWRVRGIDKDGNGYWSDVGTLPSIVREYSFQLVSPDSGTVTDSDYIYVKGQIIGSLSQTVKVNESTPVNITLADTVFEVKAELDKLGPNLITINCTDINYATYEYYVVVKRVKTTGEDVSIVSGKTTETTIKDENGDVIFILEIPAGLLNEGDRVYVKRISTIQTQPTYEIKAVDRNGVEIRRLLKDRYKITMKYDDKDMTTEEEKLVRIYWWDGQDWRNIGGEPDPDKNTVSVWTNHFSYYSARKMQEAELKKYSIIPEVITPNGDNINDAVFIYPVETLSEKEVTVYDVNGKIVKKIRENYWDGTDENGNLLETGLYVILIRVGGRTKGTFKVLLVK